MLLKSPSPALLGDMDAGSYIDRSGKIFQKVGWMYVCLTGEFHPLMRVIYSGGTLDFRMPYTLGNDTVNMQIYAPLYHIEPMLPKRPLQLTFRWMSPDEYRWRGDEFQVFALDAESFSQPFYVLENAKPVEQSKSFHEERAPDGVSYVQFRLAL